MSERDVERNKAVIRRVFEDLLPTKELSAGFAEVIHEDFVDHDPPGSAELRGLDSIRATHAHLHQRLPVVRFTIDEIIGEGDHVVLRWRAGPISAIAWFRFRDGKVVERWAMVRTA